MRTEVGDLGNGLAEVGLSNRASWLASMALYGSGGVLILVLHLVAPAIASGGLALLACGGLVVSAACGLAAWRMGDSDDVPAWQLHARLIGGLAIWTAGLLIEGHRSIAFSLLPLFSVLTPCYLYTWRMAVPYVTGAVAIVLASVLLDNEPARAAHAIVLSISLLAIAAFLMVTRERTRVLALHNRRLAFTDPLTGVANMRALRERIARQDAPFALFVLDLDNFKQVNDSFDHGMGDRVLRSVAAALCGRLERGDLVARRGGDEFAAVVVDPQRRDLDALRETIAVAIRAARAVACPSVTPTVSVGHVISRPNEDAGSLLARADQALHAAKLRSRERRLRQARGPWSDGDAPHPPAPSQNPPRAGLGARVREVALGSADPTWFFTALVYGSAGVVLASVSLGGLLAPLSPRAGGAIGAALLLITIACLKAASARAAVRWLHVASLAAYALIALAILLAGRSGTALVDMLPAISLYGFLMFEARTAAPYALVGMGAYGALVIGGGYAYGIVRTVVGLVVVAVVSGIVAKLRTLTVDFARRNRELSEVDGLTGVGNLRALRSRLHHVVRHARAGQATPLLVTIDLDEFKQVNDRHSHSLGDEVLVAVARAMAETMRVDDLVARRGGDEFCAIVDDAASVDAAVLLRRVDDAVQRARMQVCADVCPTASIALLRWHPGDDADALLRRADEELHSAKRRSRALRDIAAAG